MSSTTAPRKRSARARSQERLALLLIAPTLLVLTIVIVVPVFQSLYQSLHGQPGLDPQTGFVNDTEPFVGLRNYADIFTGGGDRFWNAFLNTTLFGVVTVLLETALGVIMALIMHKAMAGRGVVRAAILVPWAIPTAVSAILWGWIFNQNGVANAILGQHIMWASGDWSAKWSIIIADVWKTAPYIGLLTLAGLQVIPEEVYEAAKMDGAGVWKRFTSITLPLVKPALVVAVLFRTLDALRMFDLPYILVGHARIRWRRSPCSFRTRPPTCATAPRRHMHCCCSSTCSSSSSHSSRFWEPTSPGRAGRSVITRSRRPASSTVAAPPHVGSARLPDVVLMGKESRHEHHDS